MGWIIALALLFLLAILPLGVSARYDSGGVNVRLIAGPVRLTLVPGKMKDKKEKPKEKKKEPETKENTRKKTEKKSGGKLSDFLPLVQTALDFLGEFRRKLRVNILEIKIILAGGDPADLAIHYGKAWAALGNLWPRLERLFAIKKRDVEVECDFVSDQTCIYARLDLTITLGRLLSLALRYGIRALRQYFTIMNSRKGGAVK